MPGGGGPEAEGGVRVAGRGVDLMADRAGKYLTFKLAGEEYGLQILKVREIIVLGDMAGVLLTADLGRDASNVQRKVIPLVDLRAKSTIDDVNDTDQICVIVAERETTDGFLSHLLEVPYTRARAEFERLYMTHVLQRGNHRIAPAARLAGA